MTSFVDTQRVSAEDVEKIEDGTLGLAVAGPLDEYRGDVLFDLRRLRRAILAFEDEFDESLAEVAIYDRDGGKHPALALVPHGGGDRAVILASRVDEKTGLDETADLLGGEA